MASCEQCHQQVATKLRGRPRRYCSRACQARAYRQRRVETHEATVPPASTVSAGQSLSIERIVAAAVEISDAEGVEGLSMRRVAARLDAGAMSLYRYVRHRDELVDLMVDALFSARPLPEPGPDGWRARLQLSARYEWSIYLEHPWVAALVASTTRPPIAPHLMAYTDWRIRAIQAEGISLPAMASVAIMVSTFIQGAALTLAQEVRASRDSGHDRRQWLAERRPAITAALRDHHLPMIAQFDADSLAASEPQAIFEFGLPRILDGIAAMLGQGSDQDARKRPDR
ncbi:MAG TPA: TetR/AcrR family transcriptional regulator C-terminal domain-containing protein [Actinocatenispora sp.]